MYCFFTMEESANLLAVLTASERDAEDRYSKLIRQGYSDHSKCLKEARARYEVVHSARAVFQASCCCALQEVSPTDFCS